MKFEVFAKTLIHSICIGYSYLNLINLSLHCIAFSNFCFFVFFSTIQRRVSMERITNTQRILSNLYKNVERGYMYIISIMTSFLLKTTKDDQFSFLKSCACACSELLGLITTRPLLYILLMQLHMRIRTGFVE